MKNKNEQGISEVWNNFKQPCVWLFEVAQSWGGWQKLFKTIMAQNFQNKQEDSSATYPKCQEKMEKSSQ